MKAFNKYRPRDINLEVGIGRSRKTGGGSCKDSALGEQCGSVANFVKGTTTKVANLSQSLQSSHSPTANPRILEEEKGAKSKNQTGLESSSRAAQSGVAIHSPNTQKLESSIDSKETSANAERYPLFSKEATLCHADFQSARNDSNNAPTLNELAKDSRIFDDKAQTISKSQAEGFCDDFVGCQGVGEGIYLVGNEQAHAADSRKSAQKPTPPLASDYMEYYMFNEPAWNTFDPQVAQNSLGKIQRIVKVPLLTLGEVLHTYVPKGVEIDFLSIDCEGFDLAVLESNDWDSFVPHIIIVEILTNIYGELDMVALQDNEIARFLFSKGYALVAKAHNSVIFQHKDKR